jgi:hypothetical protein
MKRTSGISRFKQTMKEYDV